MTDDPKTEALAMRARSDAFYRMARVHYSHGEKALGNRYYHEAKRYAEAAEKSGA